MRSYEKYLGLPALMGRSKTKTFAEIHGSVSKKLGGWKEKFLSQVGKEVLLKAVVQAILTYCMSVFSLPKTLCRDLNSLMNSFWWGAQGGKKRTFCMSWSKLGRSKLDGGLGFRDLEIFNLTLLAKQGWRILQHPESLVAKIMKEKYFPVESFF